MFNEDGSIAVVFNGEIYNFQELRSELKKRGHQFSTGSDTEVILHAWEEHGTGCLDLFRGMFAIALYDSRKGALFLARDRIGKKPFYYSHSRKGFVFGSEIKAILEYGAGSKEIDEAALLQYATYGQTVGERTIYKNIKKLLPGHSMQLDCRDPDLKCRIERYWNVFFQATYDRTEEDWLEELEAVLTESVRLRMISDVPLGAFLSGGIDSSLVAALMSRLSPGNIRTYNIGYREKRFDESPFASEVAGYLNTRHHTETVAPDALETISSLIHSYDEPFGDSSAIPTFLLSRMTRRHVTVALSGDGGDELFLGYPRHSFSFMTQKTGRALTPLGRVPVKLLARTMPYGSLIKRGLERLSLTGFDLYNHALGYSPERLLLLRDEIVEDFGEAALEKTGGDFRNPHQQDELSRYQYTDLMNYLPDDILVKVDRASMHHSLEVRCPLLDHRFVELAAQLPHHLKIKGFSGKQILKKMLARHLPRPMFHRPKQGFEIPVGQWFKKDLSGLLRQMVSDTDSPVWEFYERSRVIKRVSGHIENQADSTAVIWRLFYFYIWCEEYLR
jgi:asparagine synthase (glutamine-hydrolysing)